MAFLPFSTGTGNFSGSDLWALRDLGALDKRWPKSRTAAHVLVIPPLSRLTHRSRGLTEGRFPKGWFWRMFPRNENRNEGMFAKTTLLETALLSPNDPFLVLTEGWFPKGWFRRMFPRNENRNEGTFAKTTLLRNTALLSPSEEGWGAAWPSFPWSSAVA